MSEKDVWENAKQADDLKVFLCPNCDAVHFLMLDEDGNVIAYVDTSVDFYKALVDNVNKMVSGEITLTPVGREH